EDIGERFIQRPGLLVVSKIGRVLGDGMRQLVGVHVVCRRKPLSVHHLVSIPEGILVRALVSTGTLLNGGNERGSSAIVTVPAVLREKVVVRVARIRIGGIAVGDC